MPSTLISTRTAALARMTGELAASAPGVDVLDAAPLRYRLPYVTFQRTFLADVRTLSKTTEQHTVGVTFDAVTDPHDESPTITLGDLVDAMDAAMEAALDLSSGGFAVRRQRLVEADVFEDVDELGAELKRARLTWNVEIV